MLGLAQGKEQKKQQHPSSKQVIVHQEGGKREHGTMLADPLLAHSESCPFSFLHAPM
jgi:hypothetical protein